VKEAEEKEPKIQVSELCKKAILRVAELSSDDFHLDRHLYFACRDDRERFCENVSQLRSSSFFLPFLFKYL
jgi:Golgi apparatus protein 1